MVEEGLFLWSCDSDIERDMDMGIVPGSRTAHAKALRQHGLGLFISSRWDPLKEEGGGRVGRERQG